MSSHTTTSTTWGSIRVSHTDDGQLIESRCKLCGVTTMQAIASDANPFAAAQPDHAVGCRFHPDYRPPRVEPRWPPHQPPRHAPRMAEDRGLADWTRRDVAIWIVAGAGIIAAAHLIVEWWLH